MKHSSLLLGILLLSPAVAGFGYVEGRTTTTTQAGETATFTAYLFGGNGTIRLTQTDAPDGWQVSVAPDRIDLPVTDPDRVLQTETGYRNLRAVRVTATPPATVEPGSHPIAVTFGQAGEEDGATLAVRQERRFQFTVTVPRTDTSATPRVSQEDVPEATENTTNATTAARMNGTTDTAAGDEGGEANGVWERPVLLTGILLFEAIWVVAMWRVLR